MKALLSFTLPEDNEAFELAAHATDLYLIIWDIREWLHKECERDNITFARRDELERVQKELTRLIDERWPDYHNRS